LDRLGLIAALEWAAEECSRRSGMRATITTDVHETPLDRGRSAAVFRIVQEALSNAATHSGAAHVEIALALAPDRMVVEVTDDGKGLPQEALTSGASLGLIGMQERAALLGRTGAVSA